MDWHGWKPSICESPETCASSFRFLLWRFHSAFYYRLDIYANSTEVYNYAWPICKSRLICPYRAYGVVFPGLVIWYDIARMWVKQCHKPSPYHYFFIDGMFTIPSHGWFILVLLPLMVDNSDSWLIVMAITGCLTCFNHIISNHFHWITPSNAQRALLRSSTRKTWSRWRNAWWPMWRRPRAPEKTGGRTLLWSTLW